MIETRAALTETREPGPGYVRHRYAAPELAGRAEPGQFVHVQVGEGDHPILRRPFSVYDAEAGGLEILFKIVGEGTALLADKRAGDELNVLGPVGEGFRIKERPALLIAGGIGCAPLHFLARRLKEKNRPVSFYFGARSKRDLVMADEIAAICDEFHAATEDGSRGLHGFVTDAVRDQLTPEVAIYACGPDPMLAALKKILDEKKLEAQFSLENKMACGTGACQGCVVALENGYRRVCVDGPVFSSNEIIKLPSKGGAAS